MKKYLLQADVYKYLKQYLKDGISFGRFVELLNEIVNENIKKDTSNN